MFEFEFKLDGYEIKDKVYPAIFVVCKNCGTLTGLDEIMVDKSEWDKLNLVQPIENTANSE